MGRPTRAEAADLKELLRHTALKMFLDHGYNGTTMEAVASAAGVSKRTLYAAYPDKRALFGSVVTWALGRHEWAEPPPETSTDDLAGELTAIARSTLARALDPDIVRLSRMAMTEATRFPEVVGEAHSLVWSPRLRAVMDLLERHSLDGTVKVDDPELAAEQFLAMVSAIPARLAAFGLFRPADVEARHLDHAVTLFLRGALTRLREETGEESGEEKPRGIR
jgi:AcrR family transcriptional regulator